MTQQDFAVRRICIIGAGPSGLAAARYLLSNPHFEHISIFEQRPDVGGVWNINSKNTKPTPVPSEDPFWDNNVDDDNGSNGSSKGAAGMGDGFSDGTKGFKKPSRFDSPLYPSLETNIPHQIMAYQSLSFVQAAEAMQKEGQDIADPSATVRQHSSGHKSNSKLSGDPRAANDRQTEHPPHVPLYPFYPAVLNYIRNYSLPLLPHIHFSTLVLSAAPISLGTPSTTKWNVTTLSLKDSTRITDTYDAIVVANGHYTVPYLPSIPGIEAFHSVYPDVISHARDFRTVEPYQGKKTVVIGASASAVDIGMQIEEVCQPPMLKVVRTGNSGEDPVCYKSIDEFLAPSDNHGEKAIQFTDAKGHVHVETGVDRVLFATGYLFSFPFFPTALQQDLVGHTRGLRVAGLYKQLFLRRHPTCAFMVLPLKVAPFPLAEAQAAVLARVWAGTLDLPDPAGMDREEREMLATKGDGRKFHTMDWPLDVDYLNELVGWAGQAAATESGAGGGLMAHAWDDELRWLRKTFPDMRKRYKALGERRAEVERWEQLGIDYTVWKGQQDGGKVDARAQGQVSG